MCKDNYICIEIYICYLSIKYAMRHNNGPAHPSLMRANKTGLVSGIPREPMTEPPPNETCAVMIAKCTIINDGAAFNCFPFGLFGGWFNDFGLGGVE